MTENVLESKGTKLKVGDDLLEIKKVHYDAQFGNQVSIYVAVPFKKGGVLMGWHDRFSLEDEGGKKFEQMGKGGLSIPDIGYWEDLMYGKPNNAVIGPPAKLIVEDWKIVRYRIPFEFKDLPLP
jgi:hypothetical protein